MERLQGPINPCFFGEHSDFQCLEQGFTTTESLRFEEEEEAHLSIPSLEDRMPFLQMLQGAAESPSPYFPSLKEPSFQALLRLQHLKNPWELGKAYLPEMETQLQKLLEFESCVTHDMAELHSPVKSEARDFHHSHSISAGTLEDVSISDCNQDQEHQPNSAAINFCRTGNNSLGSPPTWAQAQIEPEQTQYPKSPPVTRERKRKRTRPTKNKEEVESQRMTHIAVERNRRRQMNDHLNVLRSLMSTSYIQRGDQASIVGGAIDFVKELEQLLQSVEAQKRNRKADQGSYGGGGDNSFSSSSSSSASRAMPSNGMFMSLSRCRIGSHEEGTTTTTTTSQDEVTAQNNSEAAHIEVTVIQTHVNLKIQCQRRAGQLMTTIAALEDVRLTVLHLNITSTQDTVIYSFNLKIEEDCKLGSADDIAGAVRQIFSFINGSS